MTEAETNSNGDKVGMNGMNESVATDLTALSAPFSMVEKFHCCHEIQAKNLGLRETVRASGKPDAVAIQGRQSADFEGQMLKRLGEDLIALHTSISSCVLDTTST